MNIIDINQLRSLDASKTYYLANSTGDIKEASLWQRFKCWIGLGDGRTKAARLIDAVKASLLQSAGLQADQNLADELGALDRNTSVSGAALAQIATRFTTANSAAIAKRTAERFTNMLAEDELHHLVDVGLVHKACVPHVRDLLRHAAKPLVDHPPMSEGGEGLRVIDTLRLSADAEIAFRQVHDAIVAISQNANLGRPKMDLFYARHVKETLWNADGTPSGNGIEDLEHADDVRKAAFRRYANTLYTETGADTRRLDELVELAIETVGDDSELAEIVGTDMHALLKHGNGKLRFDEELRTLIEGIRTNLNELRTVAKDHPEALEPGKKMITAYNGKILDPGIITSFVQLAGQQPLDAIAALDDHSSGTELNNAFRQFQMGFKEVLVGAGAHKKLDDAEHRTIARSFIAALMVDRLGHEGAQRLKSALATPRMQILWSFYADVCDGQFDQSGYRKVENIQNQTMATVRATSDLKHALDLYLGDKPSNIPYHKGDYDPAEVQGSAIFAQLKEDAKQFDEPPVANA